MSKSLTELQKQALKEEVIQFFEDISRKPAGDYGRWLSPRISVPEQYKKTDYILLPIAYRRFDGPVNYVSMGVSFGEEGYYKGVFEAKKGDLDRMIDSLFEEYGGTGVCFWVARYRDMEIAAQCL